MVCTDRYSVINICSLHFNEAICRNVKPLILPPTSVRGGGNHVMAADISTHFSGTQPEQRRQRGLLQPY